MKNYAQQYGQQVLTLFAHPRDNSAELKTGQERFSIQEVGDVQARGIYEGSYS